MYKGGENISVKHCYGLVPANERVYRLVSFISRVKYGLNWQLKMLQFCFHCFPKAQGNILVPMIAMEGFFFGPYS